MGSWVIGMAAWWSWQVMGYLGHGGNVAYVGGHNFASHVFNLLNFIYKFNR